MDVMLPEVLRVIQRRRRGRGEIGSYGVTGTAD